MARRSPLSAVLALGFLAAGACSPGSGYQLPDGAYASGNNGGYGGANIPPNDGGSDAGLMDAGSGFDAGFLFDGGCDPSTSPTGCFPIGTPCFPSTSWFNSGCATGLVCYSYVTDAGASVSTCCQRNTDGTYLCN